MEQRRPRLWWTQPNPSVECEGVTHRQQYALELAVLLDALGPVLAADTRLLVAAERAARIEGIPVDAVGAGADLRGDLQALLHIGGPHTARQPVIRVIGDLDRLVHRVVGDDRQHRAEDFLLCDGHRVVDIGKNRGLHKVSAIQALGALAAVGQSRTLCDALGDVALDPSALLLCDQRTDLGGRIVGQSDAHQRNHADDAVDHLVVP